jgi:imidazolonepropionase-like amidohydrolase
VAAHAHGTRGIAQATAARGGHHRALLVRGPDRKYGSDFDPAVVDEIAAAGIYVCPATNVHALTIRDRFGDALDKVIMGLYSGGARIIAGTDAGIGNCPRGAYVSGLEALAMVGLPAAEILEAAEFAAPTGPGPQ